MLKDIFNWLYAVFHSCFRFRFMGGGGTSGSRSINSAYSTLDDEDTDELSSSSSIATDSMMHPETKRLLRMIDSQYGTVHPTFYTAGDFKSATERAKRNYQLLLVYLHSDDHQDTPDFCRNVLCTEGFKDYVDANFIFFAADVSSPGGYALSNNLRATTYPFFAVIYVVQSQVNVVGRFEGLQVLDLDSILTRLIDIHENTTPQLVVQQTEDSERDLTRRQIEEQDRAFKEALERDRQIAEEKRRKEEEARRQQEEKERRKREQLEKYERIKKNRIQMRNNLPAEPDVPSSEMRKQGISLVKFKLPDGSQIQRKFHKDDKIMRMYEFIHCLDSGMSSWTPNEKSDVTDYELTLNFPKRLLDPNKTLAESECFPNAQVFVREEEIYEDEDEIQVE